MSIPESQNDSNTKDAPRPSTKEKLQLEIQSRLEEAKGLQEKSMALHQQAEEAEDPEEAQNLAFEARELDKQIAKLMKTAERLQSGWLQGGAVGGGIGAGIAGGLGLTIGSLITGVVAIPTAGLGMLLGAGTGMVHGPWIKFADSFDKDETDSIVEAAEEEARAVAEE